MSERATFGAELRRLRRAAGISLTEFAARTHYSKGYLSKVETGLAVPNAAFAEACERELQLSGALTALLPREPAKRRTRPDARPSGLPPATTVFTGRAAEFQAVRSALEADGGVCVISGMGGIGKTELAKRIAHRLEAGFADGCVFLDLRGHSPGETADEPSAVHDRLLRRLGVPATRIPSDPHDRAMVYQSRLRGRSLLLVLDNAASAAQVRPLLPAEPKCRVLITSRSRLSSLDDTRHVALDVLDTPSAVDLFVSLTGTAPGEVVTRVVERCAGLPLAIRIAAARLSAHPTWTVDELDRRLAAEAERLGELDDGERSLLAAFRLSLRQLSPAEARLFGLLALHPGADLDLHAATALSALPARETDRLLNRLHDAYLLTQPAPDRYGFHDLLKLFAADVVTERDGAFRRLMDFAVQVAAHGDHLLTSRRFVRKRIFGEHPPEPMPLDDETALSWFRAEWRGLVSLCRAAGERGEHERCWQLAYFLRGFFFTAKLWDPWKATHRWARASAQALGDRWVLATTTTNLGVALVDSGDVEAAFACYDEALTLYRELGDEHGESMALAHRAWADHYSGKHTEALRDFQHAQAFYARTGNRRNAAITDRGIALVLIPLGRAPEAAALAASTLTTFNELGLDLDAAMALNCLGWAWFHAGHHDRATTAYHDAADRARACGSSYETARAYTGIGNIAAARGEHALAADFWERADDVHPDLNPLMVGETRVRWGS
ncbi:ATP-binding protein [Amycolatopsis xylanica]|nr:helix-turn-helix domain-containing protein [Amycolatopsis xylanica]